MATAPPVRRRLVGKALRRYRERLGYTLEDVARVLECHPSKISRIETGERGIRVKELRELLDEYRIEGEQRALLAELADPRGAFGWYRDYADVLPGAQRDYVILEAAASRITVFEAQRVPGLLQTPSYARALAKSDPFLRDDAARDRAVEALMSRQQAVLHGERRPEIHLVVGAAALHQEVGSAQVMEEQVRVLAEVATNSGRLTLQVLEFDSGAHAAAGEGTMEILEFAENPSQSLVHLGGIAGGICLEGQADLAAYGHAFGQLRSFALSPSQSSLLLRGLAGD
jgi:transcriptional regulator with XRE-family HTH domain